jgi:hypothetical protein
VNADRVSAHGHFRNSWAGKGRRVASQVLVRCFGQADSLSHSARQWPSHTANHTLTALVSHSVRLGHCSSMVRALACHTEALADACQGKFMRNQGEL